VGQVVVAPTFGNPDEIPNEDSIDFEFDDSNIFEFNRFPGNDRADSGTRFDYGFNWSGAFGEGATAGAFIGQSYQAVEADDDIFPENAGVGDGFSDFVGRVQLSPLDEFDLLYRFRLDDRNLEARRHEIGAQFGVPALKIDLGYLLLDDEATNDDFGDREEINVAARSQLTNTWHVFGSFRRDLDAERTLSGSFGMGYEDECFTIEGVFRRKFFDDREIQPENTFQVQLVFKHLGSVQTPGL
jgi:LPS-assembly protein